MVLLGVVICKCEMSSTHFSQENEHAILMVKCQFMSYTFRQTALEYYYIFFLNRFDRHIIKSYLNIHLLFCVQQLIFCD